MKRIRIIFFMLLTFLWLGIIFSFSLQPAATEIIPLFVDGRSGRFLDVLIDSTGAIMDVSIVFFIIKMRRSKNQ